MPEFGKEPAWAIVELFGHIRHVGLVQEVSVLGVTMGRVDIPDATDAAKTFATHYFAGSAVFRITPCTEELARKAAAEAQRTYPTPSWLLGDGKDDDEHDDRDDPPAVHSGQEDF